MKFYAASSLSRPLRGNHAWVAEIKRNPNKISISDLQRKVENLPASEFRRYKLELRALSMDDMW